MGATGSTIKLQHLSAKDVGKLVAQLGDKYVDYEVPIASNGLSGEVLDSLREDEIKDILKSIGIENLLHHTILITHFKKLKGDPGASSPHIHHAPNSDDCCKYHALPETFQLKEQVTLPPRNIMTKLFEIQGIAVDPTDLDPAVDKITKAVGGGFGDGKTKYDCFINYRVASDADLAEKLYLYLATKGIYAFLDKKCLKNGEKWKDGFLTGLKNSKCFVALISKKGLERVRDKGSDHTWDNVLLEYETALHIKQITDNKKYICPLHVGECNGGNLSKFQDFNPALYPDSVLPIVEDKSKKTTKKNAAKKAKPSAPRPATKVDEDEGNIRRDEPREEEEKNSDYGEQDEEEEPEDRDEEAADGTSITCAVCDHSVSLRTSNVPDGWSCDWPSHEGDNSFTSDDPLYGCPTVFDCDWCVCETCYKDYMAEYANDKNDEEVLHVPQPEGTKSTCTSNSAYYCEIKNVRFQEGSDSEYLIMIVEYNVRGDMSMGPVEDPSNSRVMCSDSTYDVDSKKVYFSDKYQNRGELCFNIPMEDVENFAKNRVVFVFGSEGYSEARLVMPNSSMEDCDTKLPICSSGEHVMILSDYSEGNYSSGYGCDICGEGKTGFRWFCEQCTSDKCFSCEPIQVLPAAKCGHESHSLERCSGTRYGSRHCDKCSRRQLQYDPEFYHCSNHDYDLCLSCASTEQAEQQQASLDRQDNAGDDDGDGDGDDDE